MIFNLKDSSIYKFLEEMKTKEEYGRESFKKKYNYKPSKENKDIGTIKDKDGKEYKVDIRKSNKNTGAKIKDSQGTIIIGKDVFNMKGSNKNERRDAAISHEIGHQKLHNLNPNNKTVEKKNRTAEVFKNVKTGSLKDTGLLKNRKYFDLKDDDNLKHHGHDNPHKLRKDYYDKQGIKKYVETEADKKDKLKRNRSLNIAKKYETDKYHQNASEYEADRYGANHTSERAMKKAIKNSAKYNIRTASNNNKDDIKKKVIPDMEQRYKALKDKDLKKSDIYK